MFKFKSENLDDGERDVSRRERYKVKIATKSNMRDFGVHKKQLCNRIDEGTFRRAQYLSGLYYGPEGDNT